MSSQPGPVEKPVGYPHVEVIPVTKIDEAYENVVAGKVKFRYVIDMKTLA